MYLQKEVPLLLWRQWIIGGLEWKGNDNFRELLEVKQKACWRKVMGMESIKGDLG